MVKRLSRLADTRRTAAGGDAGAGAPLQLQETGEGVEKKIARVFRARRPDLGEEEGEEASAPYLAASFVAYAADKHPETSTQWCAVLSEVLADASSTLDDDDNEDAVRWVVQELVKRQVLVPIAPQIEVGSAVLAVLTEDDDWHEAIVQKALGDNLFLLLFLQYGKPQETPAANIRLMQEIANDEDSGDLQEGQCEMCSRRLLLTFHHLIPKDVHSTYLKKRLPSGVVGESNKHFLNTYGIMICRKCHSFVHHIASNDVLAREYNTLEKIVAHPLVQNWIKWIGQQSV